MIIFLFGEPGSGKTFFLRTLSNNFIEYTHYDDMDLARIQDIQHIVIRDAGAGSIVILAIKPGVNVDHLAKQWAEWFPIQYLCCLPTPLPKQ